MKSLKSLGSAVALIVAVGVVDAQAGTISLQQVNASGLQAFRTPPASGVTHPNDVIPELWGYLNGNLVLNGVAGADYLVEFTLIGSESGWTNRLKETGGNTFLDEIPPVVPGATISYVHNATGADDFLKFQFETIAPPSQTGQPILANGIGPAGSITNGLNTAARTFFVSFCIDTNQSGGQQRFLGCNFSGNSITGDVAWLALDDSGAGPNDDHDDWVGYVRVTAVPDGGVTAGLLGAALLGLSVLRRRFSA